MIYLYPGIEIIEFKKMTVGDVDILRIARCLSNICRFNGSTVDFYSVAEHSVLVSNLCTTCPKAALLHDTVEAFTGDVITPVKELMVPGFKEIEARILINIENKFNVNIEAMKEIWKPVDNLVLDIEIQHFFKNKKSNLIHCYSPERAYEQFVQRWEEVRCL